MYDGHKTEELSSVCPLDIERSIGSGKSLPGFWVEIPLSSGPCIVEDIADGQNGGQYVHRGEDQDGQFKPVSSIQEPGGCNSLNHSTLDSVEVRFMFPLQLQHYFASETGLIVKFHPS